MHARPHTRRRGRYGFHCKPKEAGQRGDAVSFSSHSWEVAEPGSSLTPSSGGDTLVSTPSEPHPLFTGFCSLYPSSTHICDHCPKHNPISAPPGQPSNMTGDISGALLSVPCMDLNHHNPNGQGSLLAPFYRSAYRDSILSTALQLVGVDSNTSSIF